MFNHGSHNPQPGQGPQAPRPPPYVQHLPAPPPLPHNFQHGPLLPPRPGQSGLHIYQHVPLGPHLAVRQPGGLPNPGQPYLHPPPPPLPPMYRTAQQNPQHSSYLAPGPPPPPGSHNLEILQNPLPPRNLLPAPSSGYNVPTHQLSQPPPGVQGLQKIPPPSSHPPSSSFSTSALPVSVSDATIGNSKLPSMASPPPPPPPPPPPANSSPPPIPPSSPPTVSSPVLKSIPLPSGANLLCHADPHSNSLSGYKSGEPGPGTEVKPLNHGEHCSPLPNFSMDHGSCSQQGGSGTKVDYLGGDGLPSKRIMGCDVSHPPPKPAEEKIVQKIEELCQHIAKNGSSYEDMVCLKESGNPDFKFLFGGKQGSEDAIAHEYFLWMKKQCLLTNKLDGIEPALPTKYLMVANELHSPVDSDMDMEMEDDITMSDNDRAVNQPVEGPTLDIDLISSESDKKKQLTMLSSSAGSEAATAVLSDKVLLSGSSGLDEQGSKLISYPDELTFGNSVFRAQNSVVSSAGATELPFSGHTMTSLTPLGNDESSSGAAAAAECLNSDKHSGQVMKGSSPFRLLQDYDSNDSSEIGEDPFPKDANPEIVSPLLAVVTENLHRDTGLNLKMDTDTGSKSLYETKREFVQLSESGVSYRAPEFSSDSQREVKETIPNSISSGLTSEVIDAKHENQSSIDHNASPKALPKDDPLEGAQGKVAFSGKYEKENANKSTKFTSNVQKIDKFGRLVKEGASDSDSDDSRHARRHNKRGKSRSRSRSRSWSRSPVERRRRRGRRSPRRRREKRSRSRSWSPRNLRSRSRSPSFRHAREFSSSIMRREKVQMPECFDFIRGRCYRGASCRYMHHDSEKNDASRQHRSKQQYEQLHHSSKNCSTFEANKKLSSKVSDHEQEAVNGEMEHNYDLSASSIRATKDDTFVQNREDPVIDAFVDSKIIKSDSSREFAAKLPETKIVKERSEGVKAFVDESDQPIVFDSFPSKSATDANFLKSHSEASHYVLSFLKDSVIQQSQSVLPDPVLEDADHAAQQTDDSSISDSSPDKTTRISPKKLHASETLQNSADSLHNLSRMLPFPPFAPNTEGNNAPRMAQLPRDHNLTPQGAEYQSQSAALESFPSYVLPNQISLFSVPLNSSSASLPPLPSLLPPPGSTANSGTAQPGVTLQFPQNCLPTRSDFGSQMFSRPFSTASSGDSQAGEFKHQGYPPALEPHQPLSRMEDFRLKPLPGSNPSSQQFGGTSLVGEDSLTQLPKHALSAADSFIRSNKYPQSISFSQEAPATKIQSFCVEKLHPGDIMKSSTQIHPYLQQPCLPYGFHHSVPDSVYGLPGKSSASSGYPPDLQDKNQSSNLPDFGLSRNLTHFNPYASTFEKPLSSRFSSDVFRQETDTMFASKHDHPLNLGHASVDGQDVGSTARGDQYDPLFDSIEPPSNSYRKSDHIQKWEPSADSDIILKLKGSNQPVDVEENNKKKEIGGIALATSLDNEEFGETADHEVGDVENGSQSNPNGLANTNMDDMEIDQIKSPGKSKKSKESRSMKLFKACLADFVKEVLKPSWRQGNMSKETFKTVVKKTVDKVSGAMKGHQIPKSKAKINQYIDSSERKLTKLVMGYVDKYAKG